MDVTDTFVSKRSYAKTKGIQNQYILINQTFIFILKLRSNILSHGKKKITIDNEIEKKKMYIE